MDPTAEQEQSRYRSLAKAILAISSICLAGSLAILVGCIFARPASKSRTSITASWIFISLTAALLVGLHAINIGAAASDLQTHDLLGWEDYYHYGSRLNRFEAPAFVLQMLFLIFEILTCRLAWYAITRPVDQAGTWRKTMWTFKILDVLTMLAAFALFMLLVDILQRSTICGEYATCGSSARIALAGETAALSYIYNPVVMFHATLVIVAAFIAIKMLPESALARAMFRVLAPVMALHIVVWIVFIVVFLQDAHYDGNKNWARLYYASIPTTFARLGTIFALQYILRVYPATMDQKILDAERSSALLVHTSANNS